MITPALSVMSAIEGIKVATPAFDPYVRADHRDHSGGFVRGAVTRHGAASRPCSGRSWCVWFVVIAIAASVAHRATIRRARWRSTRITVSFLLHHGCRFLTLGAVFLVVTGAEALYADLGHFGRKPIQAAPGWRRAAGAAAELSRAGRAGARRSNGDRQSVLSAVSQIGRCCRWWCWRRSQPSSPARR